jgi:hypothetical protein
MFIGTRNEESTSSRSQPRTISTFRTLFTTESSSPSRVSQPPTGQTSYTTQSPSIGWAVRRVRQQTENGDSVIGTSSVTTNADRNPASTENNNAESAVIGSSSRHLKSRHNYNSTENDVFQTKIQLAATFTLLIKMVDELLLRLIQHEQYAKQSHTSIPQLLELGQISVLATNFKVSFAFLNFFFCKTQCSVEY